MRAATSVATVYHLNNQPCIGDSGIHGHCTLDASGGTVRFAIDTSHDWKNRLLKVQLEARAGLTAGHPLANPHAVYPNIPAMADTLLVISGLFATGGGWNEAAVIKNSTDGCWADSTDMNNNSINFKIRLYAVTSPTASALKIQATSGVWTVNYYISTTEQFF